MFETAIILLYFTEGTLVKIHTEIRLQVLLLYIKRLD